MYNVSNICSCNEVHFCAANSAFKINLIICPSTDADSACDPELNPLTLDPPEVIREYRDSMIVNCTSSEEDHDQMYWIIGDGVSQREEEMNFISSSLILSDWNLKAECKVKLNDTFECSKDLKITIYSMYNFK